MKNTRRMLCAILAVVLMVFSMIPAFAEIYVDTDPEIYYLDKLDNPYSSSSSIYISGVTKDTKITDIKSNKKAVVSIRSISRSVSDYQYFDPDETSTYYSANIGVELHKPGKATVSFKVDGKTYKKNYTVVGYENPIKSFQLTGINSKNLKSKFAKEATARDSMTANVKAGYLKVSAANGWRVKSLYWASQSDYAVNREYGFGSKGVVSAQMPTPSMKKTESYYVRATMVNAETGGTQYVYYYLNAASSNRR